MAKLGVAMLTVHAAGGRAMLEAAVAAAAAVDTPPMLLGVTVLTSLDDADLAEIGVDSALGEQALGLRVSAGGLFLRRGTAAPGAISPRCRHWILTGLMFGALGMLLSSTIKQLENFAGIMNFVIFPMFFASSALYPLWKMREGSLWLYYLCL